MKRANTILAAAFLLVLCAMAGYTLSDFDPIRASIVNAWHTRADQSGDSLLSRLEFAADRTEGALNAALDREHWFIELYGGVQRLTGQKFVEDSYSYCVIRMKNGALTFGSIGQEQKDVSHNARATAGFAAKLGEKGIPFSAVMTPQKVPDMFAYPPHVPYALQDYHNQEADQFLSILAEQGIHTVDLRKGYGDYHGVVFVGDSNDFFRTDHHWTAHGAFKGNQAMTAALSDQYGFDIFQPGVDGSQFYHTIYKDLFLGSQGKRVGTLYAGVDDFALYHPKFDTSMTYTIHDSGHTRSGTLEEALYFEEHLVRDYYNANPYVTFVGGDWGKATVTNHLNPGGPKVVMIRDSFACAVTPFFALQCSELTTIDLRAYQGEDLLADIEGMEPDFVVLFYSPSTTVSDNMFEFSK